MCEKSESGNKKSELDNQTKLVKEQIFIDHKKQSEKKRILLKFMNINISKP